MNGLGPLTHSMDLLSPLSGTRVPVEATSRETETQEKAAKDFEAVLGTILARELRKTLPSGFFGDGSGADTFNGWFDEMIGRQIAESGALELAGMVKLSLAAKSSDQNTSAKQPGVTQ